MIVSKIEENIVRFHARPMRMLKTGYIYNGRDWVHTYIDVLQGLCIPPQINNHI